MAFAGVLNVFYCLTALKERLAKKFRKVLKQDELESPQNFFDFSFLLPQFHTTAKERKTR